MKRAFLDLDGTLLNSKVRHEITLERVLKKIQKESQDISDYVEYKSNGYSTCEYLEKIHGVREELAVKISSQWQNLIEESDMLKKDTWYEDSKVFLECLKKNKYEVILVTARKNQDDTMDFLRAYEGFTYFTEIVIVASNSATNEKIRVIKSRKGDENILVGDTEVEYEVGEVLGIPTYLLNRGFRSEDFWNNQRIKSYKDLYEILEALGCIQRCS